MEFSLSCIRSHVCTALAVALYSATTALAQKGPELDYQIHCVGPIGNAGEKFLREGLNTQDPAVVVWIDHATQSVIARTYVHLDPTALQEAIAPSGLVIGYMALMGSAPAEATVRSTTGMPFPEYEDTGDPAKDARRFLDAKAAWFAAHLSTNADHGPPDTE